MVTLYTYHRARQLRFPLCWLCLEAKLAGRIHYESNLYSLGELLHFPFSRNQIGSCPNVIYHFKMRKTGQGENIMFKQELEIFQTITICFIHIFGEICILWCHWNDMITMNMSHSDLLLWEGILTKGPRYCTLSPSSCYHLSHTPKRLLEANNWEQQDTLMQIHTYKI